MAEDCGCGGKKWGTVDRPFLAGKSNGDEATEWALTIHHGGRKPGDHVWVTGNALDTWVDNGYIVPVPA